MGLFDKKELTYLERYKKDLKDYILNPNITPLEERRINEILPFLEDTIHKKKNLFITDQLLTDILNYYIEQEKYDDFPIFLYDVLNIYKEIVSSNIIGEENQTDIERLSAIMNRILSGKTEERESVFELELFNPLLFNLFQDKNNYFYIMTILCQKKNLHTNFSSLVDYAIHNREFFGNEETFTAHLEKIITDLDFSITSGQDIEEVLRKNTIDNRKRVGIYDIDETMLEQLDDILTSADGILVRLQQERKLSQETVETLKRELKESVVRLKSVRKEEEKSMNIRMMEFLEEFKLSLNKAISEEVSKFRKDTDSILNTVNDQVQKKVNEMTLLSTQLDEETRKELQRIRSTGNETEKKLRKAISENPDLKQVLDSYMPITELIEKLGQAQAIVTTPKLVSSPTTIITSPMIIPSKEVSEDINHFLDPRIPFESRLREIQEKMQKKEEQGEIYHEKFLTLIKMLMEDCNPYLWGNSGLGKTYMIGQAFELLELPYRPINKILEDYDIIGSMLPNGDYSNPLWYQCYKYGYGAFLDELDSSNSEATIVLNSFTSNKQGSFYPFPNGEIVYRHPNFRIVAAGNTAGTGADTYFNDRKQLDESVQQRLMPLYLTPDSRIEQSILKDYPDWFDFTQKFRDATNQYAKDRKLKSAPGELTTRDTQQIRDLKNNKVFTDEEIIEYEVIENKSEDYLGYLVETMGQSYHNGREKSKKLYKIFANRVQEIREN